MTGTREQSTARLKFWAALLFVTILTCARPKQHEKETRSGYGAVDPPGRALLTPDLHGPDPLEQAPLVVVTDRLYLDGRAMDTGGLADNLRTLRRNFHLVQPDTAFARKVLLVCVSKAPARLVQSALAIALDAGFPRPSFLFTKHPVTDIPLYYGPHRDRATTAAVMAFEKAEDVNVDATVVVPSQYRSCGEITAQVVKLRAAGRAVALVVGPPRI